MLDEETRKQRDRLEIIDQQSQESYDKTVLYLSAGGIGVSLAFVRDLVGGHPIQHPCFLFAAWGFWGLSLTMTLVSMYMSHLTMRHDIKRLYQNKSIQENVYDTLTTACNVSAGLLFILGLLSIGLFAACTLLQEGHMEMPRKTTLVEPGRTTLAEPEDTRGLNRPIPIPDPSPPPPKDGE